MGRPRRNCPNYEIHPFKTFAFDVHEIHEIDQEAEEVTYVDDGCLNGLAMFVGRNNLLTLPAAEFPGLKPNPIYFTDDRDFTSQ